MSTRTRSNLLFVLSLMVLASAVAATPAAAETESVTGVVIHVPGMT